MMFDDLANFVADDRVFFLKANLVDPNSSLFIIFYNRFELVLRWSSSLLKRSKFKIPKEQKKTNTTGQGFKRLF